MMELWTRRQVMEHLHVKSRNTFLHLEKQGLPFIKLGKEKLYRPEAVEAFILEQEKRGQEVANQAA
jgi:hypothetical protein